MKLDVKMLTVEDARNAYINIFKTIIIPKREGADKLLQWIDSTDFSGHRHRPGSTARLRAACATTVWPSTSP